VSLKKKLCNPPAQRVAESGDPLVLGMFEGAGAALGDVPEVVREQWAADVAAVEETYIAERQACAAKACAAMKKLFDVAVEQAANAGKKR
jgi:hypothetical protein